MNKNLYGDFWVDYESSQSDDEDTEQENNTKSINEEIPLPKYEDRYLNDIRKLNKDWVFSQEETDKFNLDKTNLFNLIRNTNLEKINEITEEILHLENEISVDNDAISYVEDFNEDIDISDSDREQTLEERNEYRREKIKELQEKYSKIKLIIDTDEGIMEMKTQSENIARQNIIDSKLSKLDNCYIIEKTPQGNVLMIYDRTKESFKYYSDSNMPYRYLEVVARKYVKLFNCRPIFVDMEEELKLFEEKWQREQEMKKMREEEEKVKAQESLNPIVEEKKKSVFAKFKSYNKDAGGKISMAPPPKNSIPKNNVEEKENEKILLKERANRYTYEGKFANFSFIKKIERKVFNKKLGLSFADFKKIHQKK